MREIKFRAWNETTNKMYFDIEDLRPVYKVILMQYTGLKDSKGVEIYEGDIYQVLQNGVIGIIDFYSGAFIAHQKDRKPKDGFPLGWDEFTTDPEEDIELEIIGNIYQNPELLNV